MMGVINESSETTDYVVGKEFWFEYHCFESPKSCDAELWYRTHNKVLVLSIEEHGCGDTKLERLLEGCPRVYRVVFEDGFEYDVFEDELMESKEEFERPDAPKNLQESIRRILREDEYSPAGKEIIPNKIVIHKSNPKVRDRISNEGLKVRAGECYKIYAGYGEKCIPAIFATNSTNKRSWFDSTYDDDVWEINTEMIPDVRWYKDRHYESTKKHIVTFDNIPSEAIKLIHEGTGGDMIRESNDKFNKEKITKTFQDIINKTLNEIKNICGDEDDDTFPDWLSDDDCSVADSIDKITILNVEKRTNMDRTTFFKVDVNIGFNSIFSWIDYDDLMYRIANRIIGKWKIRFIFNIKEQDNTNKGEMWESGKHKNINESKFFQRRIDLDEVKELLLVNAQQIFYETKSYEQFKYELTLRAVESIMWNEYKMGWEDLPEQEEIDFVTEVSDIFEDTIKDTYDYFNNL